MDTSNWKLETIAVQAGYEPENGGPRVQPIVQSTTYKYDDAQSVADLFDLKRPGFFYTRLATRPWTVLKRKSPLWKAASWLSPPVPDRTPTRWLF